MCSRLLKNDTCYFCHAVLDGRLCFVFGTIEGLEGWKRAFFNVKANELTLPKMQPKSTTTIFPIFHALRVLFLLHLYKRSHCMVLLPYIIILEKVMKHVCTRDLLSGNYMSLGLSCAYRMYYVYYIAIDSLLFRDKNSDPLHYQKIIRREFPSWNFLRDTWKLFT